MKNLIHSLLALAALGTASIAAAESPPHCAVSLIQEPLVMRLNKNEFRIAFGITGDHCAANGCRGTIRYTADWTTDDGIARSDNKRLNYHLPNGAQRTIAVDRHYFDTAEGQHRTEVVKVSVDQVSCSDQIAMR